MIIRGYIDCFPPFGVLSTLEASSAGFQSLEFPFRWEIWLTDFQLNTRSYGWLRRLSFILRQPLDHPPVTTDPRLMSDPVSATEQVSISRRRGRWNSSPFPWCSFNVTSNLRKTCLRPVHSINYSSTTVFFPKCMQPENRGKGREGKQGTELGKLSITFFFFPFSYWCCELDNLHRPSIYQAISPTRKRGEE